jgi:hypothetical protein
MGKNDKRVERLAEIMIMIIIMEKEATVVEYYGRNFEEKRKGESKGKEGERKYLKRIRKRVREHRHAVERGMRLEKEVRK